MDVPHPLAALFPALDEPALISLAADIDSCQQPLARFAHLSDSQRALMAARLVALHSVGKPLLAQGRAAMLLNVHRDQIRLATRILAHGTPEEIAAVESGAITVTTLGKRVLPARVPTKKRKARTQAEHDRLTRMSTATHFYKSLRAALDAINAMPLARDVATMVVGVGHARNIIDARVTKAAEWLMEFEHEWQQQQQRGVKADQGSAAVPEGEG